MYTIHSVKSVSQNDNSIHMNNEEREGSNWEQAKRRRHY